MLAPPPHPAEPLRLAALNACQILDTPRELCFDLLTRVAADVADTDIALVSLVAEDRQWFKARIGLDVTQTERSISFCGHTILHTEPLIVEDTLRDERFVDNPLVTSPPHIRFYAGFPIRSRDGYPLGSLCVIHREPKQLNARQELVLSRLAQQVELELEVRRRILETERQLEQERDQTRMRSLLCQALIHDMKSPMLVVTLAAEALQAGALNRDRAALLVGEILAASDTLARMVFDALDMVHRGEPALVPRLEVCDLVQILGRVHHAFVRLFAARGIELVLDCPSSPVNLRVDPELTRRILHNLLDNAYKYGGSSRRIQMGVRASADLARFWVEDEGPGIPESLRKSVFDLYARLDPQRREAGRSGHGIGLAFCDLAARAHGGRIEVQDGPNGRGCRFCVELPRDLELSEHVAL